LNSIRSCSGGKKIKKKNGSDLVTVYSLNGSFSVKNQRYVLENGSCTTYLDLCSDLERGHYTKELGNYIEEWSDELSYRKLSKLLTQQTGNEVLSSSGIPSYLSCKAVQYSEVLAANSNRAIQHIEVLGNLPLYDEASEEVILMMDDVGVKAQKPHKKIERQTADAKRLDTTVVLVEDTISQYHCVTAGFDKSGNTIHSVKQAIIDKVIALHGLEKPIALVAITDGARSIRLCLQAIFGLSVCIILDWYHLQLKVKNLMSMIAINKKDKELFINDLKSLLWAGNTAEAIIYIDNIRRVKNETKKQELRDYLEKHQEEIINYGLRKDAGKTIGSGRGEKQNDLIVAHRQKKKGMAWSRKGSSALAVIKVKRINSGLLEPARTSVH
jgi:hypothetical protein